MQLVRRLVAPDLSSWVRRAPPQSSQEALVPLPTKPFVFLSTTTDDFDFAKGLFDSIKIWYPEYNYWHMPQKKAGAGTWVVPARKERIIRAIQECTFMVGVCTAACKESDPVWGCPAEWKAAKDVGKLVIVVADRNGFVEAKKNPQVRRFSLSVQFLQYGSPTDAAQSLLLQVTKFLGPQKPLTNKPSREPNQDVITLCFDGDYSNFDALAEGHLKLIVAQELNAKPEAIRIRKVMRTPANKRQRTSMTAHLEARACRLWAEIGQKGSVSNASDTDIASGDPASDECPLEASLKTAIIKGLKADLLQSIDIDQFEVIRTDELSVADLNAQPAASQ